jgi:ankyrin repeat protein
VRKNHISALKILLSGALLVSTIEQSSSGYITCSQSSYGSEVLHRREELWRTDRTAFYNAKQLARYLYRAIELKDVDEVQYMINGGADIRALCKWGLDSPIMIERPADYPGKVCGGSYGVGPLHFAAALGDMQMFTLLRDNGADINDRDCYNRTALYYAISSKNKDMIELLANDSAKVYVADKEGRTPLDFAEEYFGDDEDVNNLLMDKSVEEFLLSEKDPVWRSESRDSLLYHALRLKRMELFEDLINKDPSRVNARFGSGKTLWHLAVKSRDKGLAEFLRNKNANASVNERDGMGYTPLHIALINRDVEMVKLLLTVDNIDVDVNCNYFTYFQVTLTNADRPYMPLLCYAAEHGYAEMVELLLDKGGIDLDATDFGGNTALHLAVGSGNLEIVKLLVGAGAKLRARLWDIFRTTPLDSAKYHADLYARAAPYCARYVPYVKACRDIVDFLTDQLPNIVPEAEERTAPVAEVPVRDTRNVFTKIADFFRNLRTNVAQSAD